MKLFKKKWKVYALIHHQYKTKESAALVLVSRGMRHGMGASRQKGADLSLIQVQDYA